MPETTPTEGRISVLQREIARLSAERERERRALDVLYTVSLACRGRTTPRAVFEAVYQAIAPVFQPDACYIALVDTRRSEHFRAALLVDEGVFDYHEDTQYGALTGLLMRERAPLLFEDLTAARGRIEREPDSFGNIQKLSRAWAGVPLMLGEDAVGVISIQSYTPSVYDETTIDLLGRVGNVIAVALENVNLAAQQRELSAQLAERFAARTQELATLGSLAAEMVLRRPLPELIGRALRMLLDLTGLSAGALRRLDAQRGELALLAIEGFPEEYARDGARVPVEGSMVGYVLTTNRPLIMADGARSRLWQHLGLTFESLLAVPLRIGSHAVGVLSLVGERTHAFDESQVDLVQVIGNQLAIVIENAELLANRERQVAELSALGRIAHAAGTSLDLTSLLRHVHEALASVMRLDAFAIFVYDPQRDVIVEGLGIDEGQDYIFFRNEPPLPQSFTEWVIRNRRTLAFRDVAGEVEAYPDLRSRTIGSDRPAASWIGTPLFDRDDQVIGVISIQSYTPDAFDERDQQFLAGVARQVALHVQNVVLLTRRERQIRELDAVGSISQQIAGSFDLDAILRQIYATLQHVTGASSFFLLVCDPETLAVTHSFAIDGGEEVPVGWATGRPPPGSLTEWILTRRTPLVFANIPEQDADLRRIGVLPFVYGSPARPRSWAGAPLLDQDARAIGVIALQDSRPYQYDQQTVEFLEQVASHLSLGIQKVNLFQQRQRQVDENARLFIEARSHAAAAELRARRLELVNRISVILSGRLDQQEVLDTAVDQIGLVFQADRTGIMLFDEERDLATTAAIAPADIPATFEVPLSGNPMIEELRTNRQVIAIESVAEDPRAAAERAGLLALGVVSLMIVPLVSRGRVIGSIGVESVGRPRAFPSEEQDLLVTLAATVAAAFENARLFAAEQEARRTADTLRDVARSLSSTFESREVLQTILRELHHVIPYDTASVMLLDGRRLRVAALRSFGEDPVTPGNVSYPAAERSAATLAVQRRRPVLIADTAESPEWYSDGSGPPVRSWLGVPLIAKGEVLGVLNIDSLRANRFTPRDVAVAQAFASQAAVALENARLYEESVARVEQELEIARRIQANLFPRELPRVPGLALAAQCLPARETGGDFYDCLVLGDPNDSLPDAYAEIPDLGRAGAHGAGPQLAVLVGDASGKSIPAAMLMAVARSVARSEARDHITPPEVMRETNRWVAHDVPPGTFVALAYATLDLATRRLAVANAGQLSPIRRRADGSLAYLQPPGATLPLGILPSVPYAELELMLDAGDTLVFYTDGVVEAHDADGQLFGFERFEALLSRHGDLPPEELIDLVLAEVARFTGGRTHHDDMTMVVVRLS